MMLYTYSDFQKLFMKKWCQNSNKKQKKIYALSPTHFVRRIIFSKKQNTLTQIKAISMNIEKNNFDSSLCSMTILKGGFRDRVVR